MPKMISQPGVKLLSVLKKRQGFTNVIRGDKMEHLLGTLTGIHFIPAFVTVLCYNKMEIESFILLGSREESLRFVIASSFLLLVNTMVQTSVNLTNKLDFCNDSFFVTS